MNAMYSEPGLKAWQSGKWAPPGYSSRDDAEQDIKAKQMSDHVEDLGTRRRHFSRDSDQTAFGTADAPSGKKETQMSQVNEKDSRV